MMGGTVSLEDTDRLRMTNGCYQLVGDVSVVLPGHTLANGWLHQTGQRRQHIDGWVDLKDKYIRCQSAGSLIRPNRWVPCQGYKSRKHVPHLREQWLLPLRVQCTGGNCSVMWVFKAACQLEKIRIWLYCPFYIVQWIWEKWELLTSN